MASLDIFNDDAFSLTSLTKAINDLPHKPGRIGELGLFAEDGINTTTFMIEKVGSTIALVSSQPRGGPAPVVVGDKRQMIPFSTVHLPQRATILADEVQGVRAFGSENETETVQALVNKRLAKMRRDLDVTIEWQRIGAIKGIVLDADGTTELLNLFTAFNVSQQTHAMALTTDTTKVRQKVIEVKRKIEAALGGLSYTRVRVLCGSAFFDALTNHPAVIAAFDRYNDGQFLREDLRGGFPFAGCVWEEYRGQVGATKFVGDDDAYAIPEGVADLFISNYAPADYTETVNTIGLPYYAKQEMIRMNKGVEIESQSNPISLCTRPRAIVKLTKV